MNNDDDKYRLFSIWEVCRITTLSRTSLWRLRKTDSSFPRLVSLTARRKGIRRTELEAWLRARS
ncbi:helix-turn-helix transcriptional regulator [Rhizobium oryzicola]|uniref:helix-turn-helix transcriptional regulator n=1 Tax=Rhizobium oryzicola TaxID=1232668 RepID=UPI00345B59E5